MPDVPEAPAGFTPVRELPSGERGHRVFEARQEKPPRGAFLKFLSVEESRDPALRERFLSEAQACATLKHRYVAQVLAYGVTPAGRAWIAFEWIPGVSIADLIRFDLERGPARASADALLRFVAAGGDEAAAATSPVAPEDPKPLAPGEGPVPSLGSLRERDRFHVYAHLFAQTLRGLAFAHAKGMVHRGLKPSEIRVEPKGRTVVCDYGLGRGGRYPVPNGPVAPSAAYVAPEQITHLRINVDTRSDLYAIGAVFYHAFTGRPPFHETNAEALQAAILKRVPTEPRRLDPRVPPALDAIARKLLEKSPDDRYELGDEAARDLERFLRAEPVEVAFTPGLRRFLRRLSM